MLKVSEINTKKQFYEMRSYWNKILSRSVENNIFLTWEKMAPSVNQLGKDETLKILCATEGSKLVGIAPFRKTRKSLQGKFGYSIIEPLTNGNTDYAGMILAEQETQCLHQFFLYLFNQSDWDVFHFPDLPQASLTLELIKNIQKDLPRFCIEKGWICPYLTIPDSRDKLLASLNPKFRRELKRRLRKLEREHGKVELKHYYELGSLEKTMEILFELHQKRWTLDGKPGRFKSEEERIITMQTAKFFAENDWLRFYFLTVNDKPVAAELDLEYGGKLHGHLSGFDPDYSRYSVGNLLMLKVFEECVDKGITEYDFMQGDEAYKFDWTSKFRQSTNVRFANAKLSSKLISSGLRAFRVSQRVINSVIQKLIQQIRAFKRPIKLP